MEERNTAEAVICLLRIKLVEDCYNGGQAMTVRGWLQGALEAIDAVYSRRGKVVGKAVGES